MNIFGVVLNDCGYVLETGDLGRIEPQGLAWVSRAGPRSHGLCPVHRAAWRQASRCEDPQRLRRGRGGGKGKGILWGERSRPVNPAPFPERGTSSPLSKEIGK